jgi:hypothetical protein
MRLTIIPSENKISIDGESIEGCDLSWIPEFTGDITGVSQKVHAVQWYDDHGEIELVTNDSNIEITELGIFERAITIHAERMAVIKAEQKAAEDAAAALRVEYEELVYEVGEIDIDQLLAELDSESNNENVGTVNTQSI